GGQATIEEHRRQGGNPDIDVSFQWLFMFFEPDDAKLEEIRQEYMNGKMLTSELKKFLADKVVAFLRDHRKRREEAPRKLRQFTHDGVLARKMWATDFEKL
ncbi:MAG TPA: hypothetical protein VE177_01885, partial [Candidatus Binatus sp.]|nr:hypothetical protein [Candidatus Binatus sp.]